MIHPTILSPSSEAFARTLRAAGAARWTDPSYPYRQGGTGLVLQAEDASGSGVVGMILRSGYVREEVLPLAYLRDLAVEPAARGQGLGQVLVREAIAEARARGAAAVVFSGHGARPPMPDLEQLGEDRLDFQRVSLLTTTRIVPALGRWEEPEYKIFKTSNADLPALEYLLDLYRRQLAFAPVAEETEGLGGKGTDFRIARYKNELVAMTGVWDPGLDLSFPMPKPTLSERLVSGTSAMLGPLTSIPRLPRAGEPIRVRVLRAIAIKRDHHAAFRYLVDRIANESRKDGVHALEFTLAQGDPLAAGIKGRVRRSWVRSIWAAPLIDGLSFDDLGPVDPGILDPGPI